MKIYPTLSLAFLCLLAVSTPLQAKESRTSKVVSEDLLNCIQSQISELETLKPPNAETTETERQQYQISQYTLSKLRTAQRTINSINLNTQNGVLSDPTPYFHSQEIANFNCAELWNEYQNVLLEDYYEQVKVQEEKLSELKERLAKVLIKATQPSELDAYILEISDFDHELNPNSRNNSDLRHQLQNISRLVTFWQDYLAYVNAGEKQQAGNSLNRISEIVVNLPIVPRSEVVSRILTLKGLDSSSSQPEEKVPYSVESITIEIKTKDDLGQAKQKLLVLSTLSGSRAEASRNLLLINRVENAIKLTQNGNPLLGIQSLEAVKTDYTPDKLWLESIKLELYREALYLSIPERIRPIPEPESLESLILTTAHDLSKKGDWLSLWEFLQVCNYAYSERYKVGPTRNESVIPGLYNDMRAIEKFIYAQRLQEAGELADALENYNNVLMYTGKLGPYTQAQKAIERLQGPMAEQLLADQKRKAETPTAPVNIDPRSQHMLTMKRMTDRYLEENITPMVESKIATYLANSANKEGKQSGEKE